MTLASATLLTLTPPVFALAQGASSPAATVPAASPYWAVVTANAVNVRSGPSAQSAYAFGKLKQGDVVRVLQEEYGWARVQTSGNAFASLWGYVPADRRVTLSADKASATVAGRTEVRAPNADAGGAPDKSWKQIGVVTPGTTLAVLGTVDGEKDSVYKVRLPETSECWVNLQFLRHANESESANAGTATVAAATTTNAAPATKPVAAPVATSTPVNAPAAGAPTTTTTVTTGTTTVDPALSSPSIPPLLGQPVAITTTTTTTTSEGPGNGSTNVGAPGTTTTGGTPNVTVTRNGGTTNVTETTTTRRTTIGDLETQFEAVKSHPDATEEINDLLRRYQEFAAVPGQPESAVRRAQARIEQMRIITESDKQVETIHRTQKALTANKDEIAKLILDMQRRAEYTAIGVLNASAVYDGQQLPELYRVCDPMTGATIAYVTPNPQIPMSTMLGTLVGVKGGKDFDPALKLNVIQPMVIELLTTRETPQVAKSEETKPISEAGQVNPATVKVVEPAKPADAAKPEATKPAGTPAGSTPPSAAPVPPASNPAPEK